MQKLFSHYDRFLVQSVRSELEARRIPYLMKNEYAAGAVGELPWQEVQPEIWLLDDTWLTRAKSIVDALMRPVTEQAEWQCPTCGEKNDPSFAFCWHCEHPAMEEPVGNAP